MNSEKIVCPKCKDTKQQIISDIDLEGGHRVNWQVKGEEYDFARALLYLVCGSCGAEHVVNIEWKD